MDTSVLCNLEAESKYPRESNIPDEYEEDTQNEWEWGLLESHPPEFRVDTSTIRSTAGDISHVISTYQPDPWYYHYLLIRNIVWLQLFKHYKNTTSNPITKANTTVNMVLSQVIRFTLPPSSAISAPAFLRLREFISSNGQVKDQYFGYIISPKNAPLPKRKDEICWVIGLFLKCLSWASCLRRLIVVVCRVAEWIWYAFERFIQKSIKWTNSRRHEISFVRVQGLPNVGVKKGIGIANHRICKFGPFCRSFFLILREYELIFEKAIINLSSKAPLSNAELKHSMHKTFTDTYHAEGFIGGHWAYALNTNNIDELLIDPVKEKVIKEDERRLACYYLGWESIEVFSSSF